MTKKQAMQLLNVKSQAALGRIVGVSRSGISLWPDELDNTKHLMVIGAATCKGISVPDYLLIRGLDLSHEND